MKVMLWEAMGAKRHSQGCWRMEVSHHWRRKGTKWSHWGIKLVLGWIITLLQGSPFLGASVLEPDFNLENYFNWDVSLQNIIIYVSTHLSLREANHVCKFCLSPDGDVSAVVKLLLQLQSLMITVDNSIFVFSPRASFLKKNRIKIHV